jgi:hypothetical protein
METALIEGVLQNLLILGAKRKKPAATRILKKYGGMVYIEFIKLRIQTGSPFLNMNFRFHKEGEFLASRATVRF